MHGGIDLTFITWVCLCWEKKGTDTGTSRTFFICHNFYRVTPASFTWIFASFLFFFFGPKETTVCAMFLLLLSFDFVASFDAFNVFLELFKVTNFPKKPRRQRQTPSSSSYTLPVLGRVLVEFLSTRPLEIISRQIRPVRDPCPYV